MKTFCATFLITALFVNNVLAGDVIRRGDDYDPKIQALLQEHDALFILNRQQLEKIRLEQIECQRKSELYERCKTDGEPNPFLTTKFLLGSVIVSIGVGGLLGFFLSKQF